MPYLTTPDKNKLSKSGSKGEDVLQIFAPTTEALQAEMNKYQGYSRQGRVDPSLSGLQYIQQTIDNNGKWVEPSAHGGGTFSEFSERLGAGNLTGAANTSKITPMKENPDLVFAGAFPGNPAGGALNTAQPGGDAQFSLPQGTMLREGMKTGGGQGSSVRQLQSLLGITQDGDFGPLTSAAVKKFQSENGLTADGIVGPATTAALQKRFGASSDITSSSLPPPQTGEVGSSVPTIGTSPTLTPPTANATYESYLSSASANVQNTRMSLESEYQRQKDQELKRIDDFKAEMDKFTSQQEDLISRADPTKSQFYEQEQRLIQNQLDAAETASKTLETNFTENQRVTNELESLLNEGNTLIQQMKGTTGLQSLRNPRINQAIETVNSRVGVLQAVLSARSGQIGEAQRMIANASNAVTASKKDELAYLDTLFKFYEQKKSETGEYLVKIDAADKDFMENKISLLKSDLAQAEANAQYIQDLLIDPATAGILAGANVSLNDTPAQINAKLAQYTYTQEVQNKSNELTLAGYKPLLVGQKAPSGTETISYIDSKGITRSYYAPVKPLEVSAGASLIDPNTGKIISTAPKTETSGVPVVKPPTAAQQTAAGFATRLIEANNNLKSFESKISSMSVPEYAYQSRLPSGFQSDTFQSFDQAARNFINAALRPESGAAISESEFDNAYRQYIPRAGDNAVTLQQKAVNRQMKIDSLSQTGGSAFNSATISDDFSDIQDSLTINEQDKTAIIPRSVWSTLGARMDTLLASVKEDGYTLLVQ